MAPSTLQIGLALARRPHKIPDYIREVREERRGDSARSMTTTPSAGMPDRPLSAYAQTLESLRSHVDHMHELSERLADTSRQASIEAGSVVANLRRAAAAR